MHEFSRNPEMYAHMQSNIHLFRDINNILRGIGYENFRYLDLLRPSKATNVSFEPSYSMKFNFILSYVAPNIVKEVLGYLVNFLAYFESEEGSKEEIEAEVQAIKQQINVKGKQKEEEERHLHQAKQVWLILNQY